MPTVLLISGWRLYFYSNEGNEPIHIHAEKGEMECKYWLDEKNFEIKEEFSYGLTPSAKREVKGIIYRHFSYLVSEWKKHFKE